MDYRKHLTEDILPFWLDNAIDAEFGGIFTRLDQKAISTERRRVFGSKEEHCIFSLWRITAESGTPVCLPLPKRFSTFFPSAVTKISEWLTP